MSETYNTDRPFGLIQDPLAALLYRTPLFAPFVSDSGTVTVIFGTSADNMVVDSGSDTLTTTPSTTTERIVDSGSATVTLATTFTDVVSDKAHGNSGNAGGGLGGHTSHPTFVADTMYLEKYTFVEGVTVIQYQWQYQGTNGQTEHWKLTVYSDDGTGTSPRALYYQGAEQTISIVGAGTSTASISPTDLSIPAGVYWVGVHVHEANLAPTHTGGGTVDDAVDTYTDGAADPFVNGVTDTNLRDTLITYTTSPGLLLTASRSREAIAEVCDDLPTGTLRLNNFEVSASSGATITTGNSAAGSSRETTAFDSVPTPVTYDTAHAHSGTKAAKFLSASPGGSVQYRSLGNLADGWVRLYVYLTAYPSAAAKVFNFVTSTPGTCSVIYIEPSGVVAMSDLNGTEVITGVVPINLNGWTRIEAYLHADAAVGQVEFKLFLNPDGSEPDETMTSAAAINTRGVFDRAVFGPAGNANHSADWWLDDVGFSDQGYLGTMLAPNPVRVTLTATATTSTSAESGSDTLALTATGSEAIVDAGADTLALTESTESEAIAEAGADTVSFGDTTESEEQIDAGSDTLALTATGDEAIADAADDDVSFTPDQSYSVVTGTDATDSGEDTVTFTPTGAEALVDRGSATVSFTTTKVREAIAESATAALVFSITKSETIAESGATTTIEITAGQDAIAISGATTVTFTVSGSSAKADSGTVNFVLTPSGSYLFADAGTVALVLTPVQDAAVLVDQGSATADFTPVADTEAIAEEGAEDLVLTEDASDAPAVADTGNVGIGSDVGQDEAIVDTGAEAVSFAVAGKLKRLYRWGRASTSVAGLRDGLGVAVSTATCEVSVVQVASVVCTISVVDPLDVEIGRAGGLEVAVD